MINLLPKKNKDKLRQEYIFRLLIVSFFMISILSAVASLFIAPSYKYSVLRESISQSNLEIFNAQNPQIDIDKLNNEILKTNEKLSFIISKKNDRYISEDVLEKMLSLRTRGIVFSQVSYSALDPKKITVQVVGTAVDRAALRTFKDALSADPAFLSVDLPISNFIKPQDIDFNMILVLK
ncbi:MAG: hypothetical protein KBD48_02890 [Candidatus Pacebacteria bacterium]|nr:hypothetical protein [Candidatus Paceibacterota bacterium]MBP9716108.1 hypothetical protein [Candidatus Paceibacterota bacterium]